MEFLSKRLLEEFGCFRSCVKAAVDDNESVRVRRENIREYRQSIVRRQIRCDEEDGYIGRQKSG